MRKRRIFIASAEESKEEYAKPIAQALSDKGYEVVRWWNIFRSGDFPIERIIKIVQDVEGGVFVCTGIDKTWYRGKQRDAPRDNLILELGLFLPHLGRGYCLIIKDSDTMLPSDLDGLTFLSAGDDVATLSERVISHFEEHFQERHFGGKDAIEVIPIEIDPHISERTIQSPLPNNWHQRALYVGLEGAKGWLSISSEPDSYEALDKNKRRHQLLRVIRGINVSTFVSMGPGDAETDQQIAINISKSGDEVVYIPIDISEGLLQYAFKKLSPFAYVPVGILSDFEERLSFIFKRLESYASHPFLVGMLGNTLGNLDRFERDFLQQMNNWLKRGDLLLLEATITKPGWTLEDDLEASSYKHSENIRKFYSRGIAWQLDIPAEEILNDYDSRIKLRPGLSDVPETISLDVIDEKTATKAISIRKYNWSSLLKWIKNEFNYELSYESNFLFKNHSIGAGIALFNKK